MADVSAVQVRPSRDPVLPRPPNLTLLLSCYGVLSHTRPPGVALHDKIDVGFGCLIECLGY